MLLHLLAPDTLAATVHRHGAEDHDDGQNDETEDLNRFKRDVFVF